MAYTTPRTWVTGELVTDTLLNTHLRDNLLTAFPGGMEWQSYTPTTAGLTLGNGTLVGRYYQIGGLVTVQCQFTLGTTSAVTGGITFTTPVTAATDIDANIFVGVGGFYDSSAGSGGRYPGLVRFVSGTTMAIMVGTSPATNPGASNPFTWATGDIVAFSVSYEAN